MRNFASELRQIYRLLSTHDGRPNLVWENSLCYYKTTKRNADKHEELQARDPR
jgi:hypothetical protein